jgi:hypothetical protein
MAVLDPTTPLGKIRLRIGDWHDLVILPDAVITSALDDCQNNVPRAAALCAQYILATLTSRTHKKMAQLETWSGEQFTNYLKFIQATITNPHLMDISPIPYVNTLTENPLIKFVEDWNSEFVTVPSTSIVDFNDPFDLVP